MGKAPRLLAWSLGLLMILAACRPGAMARLTIAPSPSPATGPTAGPADRPTSAPTPPGLVGRWIEVDLAEHVVRLHDSDRLIATYLAATGEGSRPEYVTYPGLFEVQQKYKGPGETVPGVYVTDVLVFDLPHGNGFHSFPVDKEGKVLDGRVGMAVTAGCVRTAESSALYDFADLGTPVWIH